MNKDYIRVRNFEKLGLGLFVHWGLYSILSQGEWTERIHKIPKEEYEKLIEQFSAEDFSAKELVRLAKKMGAKYITLTTKHHEGFYLYDTKGFSDFDVMHSPAKRDLVKEFVDACREEDILPFFYMATFDWHSELFEEDFNGFLDYLKDSVEILCKNYGDIGGFWFDGNWSRLDSDWKLDELYSMIRSYQPNAMIINNTGLDDRGTIVHQEVDAVTFEKGTPETVKQVNKDEKYIAGEICTTLNYHWGVAHQDLDYKSLPEILELMCFARRVGTNFLLNISPLASGAIPVICQEYMKMIGQWLEVFGESFYETETSEIYTKSNEKDFALETSDSVYFFMHDLRVIGDENVVLRGDAVNPRSFLQVKQELKNLRWLDNEEKLTFSQDVAKGLLTMDATGYRYGVNWVVRVAKADKV
ncbi:alpha-L-fucosidase [Pilibacter termitis]|uniref:alpha-L-fucosidase n=1 Tax=Pilibacter termitis TaxID=263852 RepID=A0A1T4MAJ5_9ENTE|nr:alpha-L-fucosidase [Pilibacter termitis]SJZ63935.1 alpha-L-fucosidase [Pilibacter termitis]